MAHSYAHLGVELIHGSVVQTPVEAGVWNPLGDGHGIVFFPEQELGD